MKNKLNKKAVFISGLFCAAFLMFIVLLFNIQILDSSDSSSSSATVSSHSVSVQASRGEMLDTNGNALVYNEQVNTVIFDALTFPEENEQRNTVILKLINYLEKNEEDWVDTLPLEFNSETGAIQFKEKRETDIRWLKSTNMLGLNSYATAQNCFDALIEEFELEGYSKTEAIKIASVRYYMRRLGFSASNPYTFSQDVSIRTIAYIKENSDIFPGVDAQVTSERTYVGDGTFAAHILGVVSAISSDEYAAKKAATQALLDNNSLTQNEILAIKAKAYSLNDKIGKSGLELAMEEFLRGQNGTKKILIDADGNNTEEYSVVPQTGNTIVTTFNKNLQEIAEDSLAKRVNEVTASEALASGMTLAGAVAVIDVNSGAVLAAASYPDYSLSTYKEDYAELVSDAGSPLWNRAFQSAYSPGSTMKPVIAIAALEEGLITGDSRITCTGQYEYLDQTFACFNKNAHGTINVKRALGVSCNIFFFDLARKLGIDKMNEYSKLFGLGQKTGVEIYEEAGILAGIEYRDSIGQGWKAGETLLAAIGQSDNSFTPLQLANYCATIANGGTRYVPYLVSKVLSSDFSEVLYEKIPEVAVETNVSQTTLDVVKEGMYLVANETSCKPYLGSLKYKVACKTGTAEKTRIVNGVTYEGTDGFLIAFGPYENAEIAIAVVIENAGSGSSTAQVAADIFEYYFSTMDTVKDVQSENTLLG